MINIAKGYLFVIENLKTKISNDNFQPSGFDIPNRKIYFWRLLAKRPEKNRVALNALWVMKMQIQTLPKVGGGRIWNT